MDDVKEIVNFYCELVCVLFNILRSFYIECWAVRLISIV